MSKFFNHPWFFRGIIALYVATIFVLVASYFAVSTVDIDVSVYLQAPSKLVAGRPNAARGIVLNAPTGKLFVGAQTTFDIGETRVGEAETERHGHLHAQLEPQAPLLGKRSMAIGVQHPAIDDFTVDVDVEVVSAADEVVWPVATSRRSEGAATKKEEWTGDLKVRLLPGNLELPRGLPSVAYLLLTDVDGRPVAGSIKVEMIEGMVDGELPTELRTDSLGLARLELTPVSSLKLTLSATAPGDAEGTAKTGSGEVRVVTVASQFSMRPTQLLAAPGEPVEAVVWSLHRSGGLLVDLYARGTWVAADAFGIAPDTSGVRAIVPASVDADLVRMQVYQDLFDPANAWDSRWLARAPSSRAEECPAAVERVLRLLAAHDEDAKAWATAVLEANLVQDPLRGASRCNQWLEAALLAVPQHFEPSPLLVNTQKGDREELDVWRRRTQAQLIAATTLVLVVGFLFVLLLVLQGMQRSQRQAALIREVELETATDSQLTEAPSLDVEKWLVVLRSAIIILSIFTFGASLIMLLSWM